MREREIATERKRKRMNQQQIRLFVGSFSFSFSFSHLVSLVFCSNEQIRSLLVTGYLFLFLFSFETLCCDQVGERRRRREENKLTIG